jgi:hypothetical protein
MLDALERYCDASRPIERPKHYVTSPRRLDSCEEFEFLKSIGPKATRRDENSCVLLMTYDYCDGDVAQEFDLPDVVNRGVYEKTFRGKRTILLLVHCAKQE